MDRATPSFWKNLKVGDMVTIKTKDAVLKSIEENGIFAGMDYVIDVIHTIQEGNDLVTWIMFGLNNNVNLDIRLIAKIVEQNVQLSLMCECQDFEADTKSNLLESDSLWLFKEPNDTENYNLEDVFFADKINWFISEENKNYIYDQNPQGILYGESSYLPAGNIDGIFTTIVEYHCNDEKAVNSELILIEEGEDDEEGGYISALEGNIIDFSEVEIFQNN